MKRLLISLSILASFAVANAQELVEVMTIQLHDSVITLKVSDIKSFSFDMIEWIESDTPEDPSPDTPENSNPDTPVEPETPELPYELRVLTFEDEGVMYSASFIQVCLIVEGSLL